MMKTYRIGVLPGDGIGEEVVREGMRAVKLLSERFGFRYEAVNYPFGADHFLKTGEIIPDSAFAEMKKLDAIFLGAIGDPRIETGKLERGIVGRLRWDLLVVDE